MTMTFDSRSPAGRLLASDLRNAEVRLHNVQAARCGNATSVSWVDLHDCSGNTVALFLPPNTCRIVAAAINSAAAEPRAGAPDLVAALRVIEGAMAEEPGDVA